MVFSFTVIPFAHADYYPELSIPMNFDSNHSAFQYISVGGNIVTYGSYNNFISSTTSQQHYGSYWNSSLGYRYRFYLGRMNNVNVNFFNFVEDPYAEPSYGDISFLSPNVNYRPHYSFNIDLHNYLKDGNIEITVSVLYWNLVGNSWSSESVYILDHIDSRTSPYFNSTTGIFNINGYGSDCYLKTDSSNNPTSARFIAGFWIQVNWLNSNGSSAQGGYIEADANQCYYVPYYENSEDAPVYPNYNNGSLDDFNNLESEVDSFVSGNLDQITDMFSNGLKFLSTQYVNTVMYFGSILTTLTNNNFLSALLPISLSLGFIAFLFTGASLISKHHSISRNSRNSRRKGG